MQFTTKPIPPGESNFIKDPHIGGTQASQVRKRTTLAKQQPIESAGITETSTLGTLEECAVAAVAGALLKAALSEEEIKHLCAMHMEGLSHKIYMTVLDYVQKYR